MRAGDKKNFRNGKRKQIRFPGIVRHARALGYSRIHLYFLLTGARPWQPGVKRRYQQLLKSEGGK